MQIPILKGRYELQFIVSTKARESAFVCVCACVCVCVCLCFCVLLCVFDPLKQRFLFVRYHRILSPAVCFVPVCDKAHTLLLPDSQDYCLKSCFVYTQDSYTWPIKLSLQFSSKKSILNNSQQEEKTVATTWDSIVLL